MVSFYFQYEVHDHPRTYLTPHPKTWSYPKFVHNKLEAYSKMEWKSGILQQFEKSIPTLEHTSIPK